MLFSAFTKCFCSHDVPLWPFCIPSSCKHLALLQQEAFIFTQPGIQNGAHIKKKNPLCCRNNFHLWCLVQQHSCRCASVTVFISSPVMRSIQVPVEQQTVFHLSFIFSAATLDHESWKLQHPIGIKETEWSLSLQFWVRTWHSTLIPTRFGHCETKKREMEMECNKMLILLDVNSIENCPEKTNLV